MKQIFLILLISLFINGVITVGAYGDVATYAELDLYDENIYTPDTNEYGLRSVYIDLTEKRIVFQNKSESRIQEIKEYPKNELAGPAMNGKFGKGDSESYYNELIKIICNIEEIEIIELKNSLAADRYFESITSQ